MKWKKDAREAVGALAAVSLSSWISLLDREGVCMSSGVLEMYSLFRYDTLHIWTSGILKMQRESLIAYVLSAGVVTG